MLPLPLAFPPPPLSTNQGRPPWLPDLPPPLRSSAAIDFRTTSAAFSSPFCPDSRCVYPGRGSEARPAAPPAAAEVLEHPADLLLQHLLLLFPCSSTHANTILQRLYPAAPRRRRPRLKEMNVCPLQSVHPAPAPGMWI